MARRPSGAGNGGIPPWLFNGLAVGVAVVWAISFVADALPGSTYDPPVAVHAAFMVVLGAVFGVRIARGGD